MRRSSKLAGALSVSFVLLVGLGLATSSVASAAPSPANPDYAVLPACSASPGATGALVVLTNAGAHKPVVFTVNGVDHTVEPDATDAFVIPGAEGDTVHLRITAADPAFTPVELGVLVDCVQPAVTLTHGCADGGVLASLTNPAGVSPAVFTIEVDGTPFGGSVTVAGGAASSVLVPMSEDQTATITVREASEANPVASAAFTHDCVNPSAPRVEECANQGCTEVLPFEIDRAPAAELPRTGDPVAPLLLLASLLLLTGFALTTVDSACTFRPIDRDTHAESDGGSD